MLRLFLSYYNLSQMRFMQKVYVLHSFKMSFQQIIFVTWTLPAILVFIQFG